MTTFTTEDRELVELHVKSFQTQQCALTHPPEAIKTDHPQLAQHILKYRIEDSSEDLVD
jgi:hypothetical protein